MGIENGFRYGNILAGERHTASGGGKLTIQAIAADGRLLLEVRTGANGYKFGRRVPVVARVVYEINPTTRDMTVVSSSVAYASGQPMRHGHDVEAEFHAFLDKKLSEFVENHPEIFSLPSFVVRELLEAPGAPIIHVESALGTISISTIETGLTVENTQLSRMHAPQPATHPETDFVCHMAREGSPMEIQAWRMTSDGLREDVPASPELMTVLATIRERFDLAPEVPSDETGLSTLIEVGERPHAPRPAPAPRPASRLQLPASIKTQYGVETVADLVSRLDAMRAKAALPPIPSGSIPTNMIGLRAFLRQYEGMCEKAGEVAG